ncbi:MAG: helix-turn-helix domain-containing protein, partial [Ruminiclostridium sp.]|nr:helix-turn-helix domain-containing protein [Ruminiclostridium sp.]
TEMGKRLRTMREERHLTQQELANRLGIAREQVTRYETGTKIPPLLIAIQISDVLGCSLDYLVGRRCN